MSLRDRLSQDLKEAMKGGDDRTVGVLRMVLSVVHNREIEKRSRDGEEILTDDEFTKVLAGELKKRKEAAGLFRTGGREELARNEELEQVIIQKYLPEPVSAAEMGKIVTSVITAHPESREFGFLMKEVVTALRGRGQVDGGAVANLLRKKLGEL